MPEVVPDLGEILQSPDLETLIVAVFFPLDWSQVALTHFGPAAPFVKVDVVFVFHLWSRHSDVIRNGTSWKVYSKMAALGELSTP